MYGFGFGPVFSRRMQFAPLPPGDPRLKPGPAWSGTAESGYAIVPVDPVRTTAKPACRLLDVPNQTVTGELVVGVFAAANEGGTLLNNLGMSRVDFHFEGSTMSVASPTIRTFARPDGSTYPLLGWWVTIAKPEGVEGLANLYVEAVPADPSMQNRVTGPHTFLLYDNEFDHDLTVGATGADFTRMTDAWNFLRSQSAQRPRITVTDSSITDIGNAIGFYLPEGFVTVEANVPVTFRQAPPALPFDFTFFRTRVGRTRFKGANITIDFVETLQMKTEDEEFQHWFDGCNIVQSRGREDLWRSRPRDIIPALIEDGAYFTDCNIRDVNDWGDKTPLARGNVTLATWGDALQGALCAVANTFEDHSSAWYYENVDSISVEYTGSAASATISLSGGNVASSRTLTLKEDGATVATFTILSSEQAYRDNTNYTMQNVVDFVNGQNGWSATLLDNSRLAAALGAPGTTNGSSFSNLEAKGGAINLVGHFDVHSDIYQLPNLGKVEESVVFAFNRGWQLAAQDLFISGTGGIVDSMFIGNAFHNVETGVESNVLSQLNYSQSHVVIAHNTLATQRLVTRGDIGFDADSLCLVANNSATGIYGTSGQAFDPDLVVTNNHVWAGAILGIGDTGTTSGGDNFSLYVDAANGDFSPVGELLANQKAPIVSHDLLGQVRGDPSSVGAIA